MSDRVKRGSITKPVYLAGLSSLGVPGHTQILADQLTLFQPGGTDYAHLITTGTPRFSDLPCVGNVSTRTNEDTFDEVKVSNPIATCIHNHLEPKLFSLMMAEDGSIYLQLDW